MLGLQPGPLLFQQQSKVVWGLIMSMFVGNIILAIINIPLAGLLVRVLAVPPKILYPIVMGLAFVRGLCHQLQYHGLLYFDHLWTNRVFSIKSRSPDDTINSGRDCGQQHGAILPTGNQNFQWKFWNILQIAPRNRVISFDNLIDSLSGY